MGRLFWKFFLLLLLAQILTTLVVGAALWVDHRNLNENNRFNFEPTSPHLHPRPIGIDHASELGHRPPKPPMPFGQLTPHIPLLPIFTGGLISLILAAILAWRFSKPIRNLSSAIRELSKGELKARVSSEIAKRNDELSDLGKDFNLMADQIQNHIESKQRLLHDVSHELRSPLARIQAATELVQQQPNRAHEFIIRVNRDTELMDKLLGELLTLSRIDSAMNIDFNEIVNLNELLGSIADDAELESETRQIEINFNPEIELFVNGSAQLLSRAFENVLRNAIRHTPIGSTVTIKTTILEDFAMILISDQGSGVQDISISSIFEPFVRGSQVESRSGHGLGLAIAKRVVEAHHGEVSAVNIPASGLLVSILIPRVVSARP